MENGTWGLMAEKFMRRALENSKNLTYTEAGVHIKSAMNEKNIEEIEALAEELCK
jgi:flavorubredoxin